MLWTKIKITWKGAVSVVTRNQSLSLFTHFLVFWSASGYKFHSYSLAVICFKLWRVSGEKMLHATRLRYRSLAQNSIFSSACTSLLNACSCITVASDISWLSLKIILQYWSSQFLSPVSLQFSLTKIQWLTPPDLLYLKIGFWALFLFLRLISVSIDGLYDFLSSGNDDVWG